MENNWLNLMNPLKNILIPTERVYQLMIKNICLIDLLKKNLANFRILKKKLILMYKYKTEGRSPKDFSDRFIYNFQERWCKPKRSIRSRRSIKRKSKIKIKRPNKCNIKCSKFFWLKRKNYYFFKDYSILISEAKYKAKHGEGLKILSPKQMFQKLPIAMAQVNAGNTSENLCNEIRKIMYFLYR